VTRRGGGAAVPARPELLRAILRAAVTNATPYGVPVTAKFRMGLFDDWLTHVRTGEVCAEEGIAAIALHARTVEQHYSGTARWEAIAELKQTVGSIPVLGNGDIWEADDAVGMMAATGCDGVVIGRGCLGRPWLFGDLVDALSGREVRPSRSLGEVMDVMLDHARLLALHLGESHAMRDFRKHTGWYMSGYPVGPDARRRFSHVKSLMELEDVLAELDPSASIVEGGERIKRGHTNGPIKVSLPDGWLDAHDVDRTLLDRRLRDDRTVPDDGHVMALSGG
jgi:nifR3 family TIM-barrel protein